MSLRLSYQSAALRICVDSIENSCISGRIVSQRLSAPVAFSDVTDFLVQVDALLDVQKYPQAFQRIRSFTDKELPDVPAVMTTEEMASPDAVEQLSGRLTTFLLYIYSRQNASWQGAVDWLDGSPKQNYDSSLALMKMVAIRLGL